MHKYFSLFVALLMGVFIVPINSFADDPVLRFTAVSTQDNIWSITNAGDGSDRLFLVDQRGRVLIVENGQELSTPFLDIQNLVMFDGAETGMSGLAFAPDYKTSGNFYVLYVDTANNMVLARFKVSDDPNIADSNSRQTILSTAKSQTTNTFGKLQFGPDGMLYVSQGDDGAGGTTGEDNAQDGSNLLGKLLRIDVDPKHGAYAIPANNPFVGNSAVRDEIWALGLRDCTGVDFDRGTGDLFLSDYANTISEINFQSARSGGGENYGWNIFEGSSCVAGGCNGEGMTLPVAEYPDSGVAVGGEVYRGHAYPNMKGMYFYGDFLGGHLWGLRREGDQWVSRLLSMTNFSIAAFGSGEDGSIYLSDNEGGVYLISDGPVQAEPDFSLNAGFSDAWYYMPTSGQGFFITVWEEIKTVFLAWFTYDVERPATDVMAILGEPGQRWITAQGTFDGATATLDVYNSSGGVFDSVEPAVGPPVKIGTMTITWTDCNTGVLTYNIPSLGLMGTVPIVRIVTENAALCEALQ